MKHLYLILIALVTLVCCNSAGDAEKSSEETEEKSVMRTACDCINAVSELDMEDSAAVAAFEEAHGETCEALVMDTTADFSGCAEAAAEFGFGAE